MTIARGDGVGAMVEVGVEGAVYARTEDGALGAAWVADAGRAKQK